MKKCATCKATIDPDWVVFQEEIKLKADLTDLLNEAFVSRCIYCYKQLLELSISKQNEWCEVMLETINKRKQV